jgi:hypothetical protein
MENALLAPHRPRAGECRVWVRYSARPEGRVRTQAAPTVILRKGIILGISRKGLSLLLDSALPAGIILKVEMEGPGRWRVLLARVLHATEQAEGWLHGCELANILSEGEIRAILA